MPYTISAEESRRFNVSRALEILPDAPDAEKVWGVRTLAGQARMTLPAEFTSNPSDALSRLQEAYRTNSIEPLQTDDFKETEKLLREGKWDELAKRGAKSDTYSVKAGDRAMVSNDEDVALLDEQDQTRFRDLQKRVKDLSTFDTWQDTGLDIRSREYADIYARNERDLREAEGQFNALLNEARKRGAAMRHVQRVRQKNAFTLLNSISADLDDRTREIVDRAVANGYKLADGDEDAFALPEERGGLPESQKELAASFLLYCKPVEGKGAWDAFLKRMGDNAAQVVGNTASGVGDLFSGVFHGFDKDSYRDRVNRRAWRNRINQRNFADLGTLGNSFAEAGGIIGYWTPQLIGGAVGRGTRLAAARLPGLAGRIAAGAVGTANLFQKWGPEAMYFADYRQQFLERVALDGGDVTNPAFQVAATVGAAASAYVEHIQWGRAMGQVGLEEVQAQAYAKLSHRILAKLGIKVGTEFGSMTAGRAARLVLMERGLSAVTEGFEEAIQQAIEETVVQIGDGKGFRLADIADQSGEAFVSTLGPMMWTMMFGLPFRAKSAATMHNLDGDAIDRLMSAGSRLKRLAAEGKLDQGGDDLASLNELLFVTSRAPNADAGVRSLRERGFSQRQAADIWNTFEAIKREAIQHGQMEALGRNVLPTREELERTGWTVNPDMTASRMVETADGRKRRQTIKVRTEASQAVNIADDEQAASSLNTIRQDVEGRMAPSVNEDGTPGAIPLADKIASTYGFDLSLDNEAILANPAMREGLARYAADNDLRIAGNTRLVETRKAKGADGAEIDEDVFDVPLTEKATRQTIFHEVAHAVATTLRNMGLSEKEIDAIQNWRSGLDGKAPSEADLALPQVAGEAWDEERVGDELGDLITEPDARGRVAKAMNFIGDMTRRILGIQKQQNDLHDAVSVLRAAVERGFFGNIDDLNDAQRRVLLAARQKRAEDREKRKAEPPAPGPAEGAVIAPAPPPEEEKGTKPEGSSSGEEGPSSEPAAEEPKSALERGQDAFVAGKPLQADEMAALAASGDVGEDEIYATGYRWHYAANAWVIAPEAVGQAFVPSDRYMGLDGMMHDAADFAGDASFDFGQNALTTDEHLQALEEDMPEEFDRFQVASDHSRAALADIAAGKEYGILYNEKYGEIRYPLGKPGDGGMGFLHIVEHRINGGATLEEAIQTAVKVGIAAEIGEETKEEYNTRHLDYGGTRAIIAIMPDKTAIITGFEIDADEKAAANRRAAELAPHPHVSSEEVIGRLREILAQTAPGSQAESSGRPQVAARQTDTAQFKRWFGKSKVVDRDGKPKIVYHFTRKGGFEAFDRKKGVPTNLGFHFGAERAAKKIQSDVDFVMKRFRHPEWKPEMIPAYLSIQNPLRMDDVFGDYTIVLKRGVLEAMKDVPGVEKERAALEALDADWTLEGRKKNGRKIENACIRLIKAGGFDGVVYKNEKEGGGDSWIAFDPEQVKHATENGGAFDRNDPRFRYAVASRPSPEFAMDGTIADALPAHLREDARAIIRERAGTPAWMADQDGTPTDLSERDWLRREAERRHNATRFQVASTAGAERLGIRNLADAEAMERSGASRLDIWRETGWWRGTEDRKWRVEVGDIRIKDDAFNRLRNRNAKVKPKYNADNLPTPDEIEDDPALVDGIELELVGQLAAETTRYDRIHGFTQFVKDEKEPGGIRFLSFDESYEMHLKDWADKHPELYAILQDAEMLDGPGGVKDSVSRIAAQIKRGDITRGTTKNRARMWWTNYAKKQSVPQTLGELVEGPILDAYPELRNIRIVPWGKSVRNSYAGEAGTNHIAIRMEERGGIKYGPRVVRETLAHEIAHQVQRIEGLTRGSSPESERRNLDRDNTQRARESRTLSAENDLTSTLLRIGIGILERTGKPVDVNAIMAQVERAAATDRPDVGRIVDDIVSGLGENDATQDDAERIYDKVMAFVQAKQQEIHPPSEAELLDDAREAYMAAGGEVEARMVEARLDLTDEQKKEIPPWVTEAVVRQDTFGERTDYSYAAQRAMMDRMAADGTLENPQAPETRFAVAPRGVQKQAGVEYPDAGEEIARFQVGAKRRAAYADVLARKRPDLDANDVLKELDKLDDPKKEKLALHWIVRGTIRLPEDAYKVEDAIEVAGKAKVDPFQYGSPMELLEAHREFKPTPHNPIDPDTVQQLTGRTDMGHGVTVYLVQDDAEGQKAMREILNAAYGKEFSPWCLLHGDGKGGLSSQAAHWWGHYSSLPKKVAFMDGKPIAFMATANSGGLNGDAWLEIENDFLGEYESYKEEHRKDFGIQNFESWMYETHPDQLKQYERPVAEEWWDLNDKSHGTIAWTGKIPGDPLGRSGDVELTADGGISVSEQKTRESDKVSESWGYGNYERKTRTETHEIDETWTSSGSYVRQDIADKGFGLVDNNIEFDKDGEDGETIDIELNQGEELARFVDGKLVYYGNKDAGISYGKTPDGWPEIYRPKKTSIESVPKMFLTPDGWIPPRPADSIGPEEREQGGRAAVAGRVRAFDDEPQYSPRASLAAVATMELLAGREPDRDALEQMRTRLGLEADVDEVIGEAKAVLDSAVGEIARRGAGRNPGAVAVAIAESVQASHPEDLVQEAFRAGANAQKWAQGTRGAALNAIVRNTRGDNYADLVMETGVDATGVLQSFPDMVRRRRTDRQEPAPAPAGERPDEATEAKPAAAGEPPSLADIGPIDPNSPEGRRIAAIREQQEANIEKAIRETEKEMEQRRLDAWLEDAAKRQKAEADAKAADPDSDDDGGDADLDEGDESGVSDEIKIPVEVLERNLVDASDPETFTLWLRKVVRNRILKANGMSADFQTLKEAQEAERQLWANPTNVAAFAKSMSAILRDMARRMLDHGSGAYTEVIRKAATLPHYDNVDAIEDEVAFEVGVMSSASISQTSAQLVNETRRKLKRDFIGATKPNEHPELQDDLVRKITGRVREMAKWYRRVLSLSEAGVEKMREQLEARLEERGRNLDEAGMTEKADRENDAVWDWTNWKLSVLDRFGGTRYLLPSEARERCSEIQTWMAKEGMAWAQKMEAITRQYEADRKTIVDGCRIVDKDGRTVKHEKDTRGEAFWRYTVNTIDQRLRLLFARAGGDAGRAAKALRDRTSLRLAQGTTRYKREKQEMHRALLLAVRNVVGQKGVRAWIERMTQEIPEEQAVELSKQNNRHLTYGQVMHLYGYLRQTATYGENIAKYGREEQRDYIERNVLTAEDIKILDGMMQIYADNRRALDEASRDLTGFPIKNPDPFYLPVKIKQKARSGLETTVSTVQAMPAVFSERRRHGLDVDEKADVMVMFYDRMEQTARVLGFGRTGLDIIHTFGSSDVKEAITEARGAKFTTALIAHFTDWMNGGRPRLLNKEGEDAAVLNSLRTAFVYTALWGNMLSAFKQTLSAPVFTLAREAGERGIFRDMMGVFSDGWKQAKAELTQSDPWKARYGDVGLMQETEEAVKGSGDGTIWQAILRAGMQPLQWGDATPGILCQVTAYMVERDRLIEEGTEPEEAKRIAADKAMQQVEWTQQSSRPENLPEYSRRGSSAMRMMMMFASSPMLQAGWEVQRYNEWKEKREAFGADAKETKDAAAALWNAVVVNHVVMPVLFQTATAIFNLALGKDPPDEKDAIELAFNMLIGPFARLVFLGGMAKAVWNAAWSQGIYGRSDVVPSMLTSSEQNVKDVLVNIPVDLFRGDMDAALEDIDKFLKRNVAPYRHGRQADENWTD